MSPIFPYIEVVFFSLVDYKFNGVETELKEAADPNKLRCLYNSNLSNARKSIALPD